MTTLSKNENFNVLLKESKNKIINEKYTNKELEDKIDLQQETIDNQRTQLEKIYNGKIWRILSKYFKIRDKIIRKLNLKNETFIKNNTKNYNLIEKIRSPKTTNNELNKIYSLAKYDIKNTINVITPTFYDFNGENYFSGGAERYLTDLYTISKKLNFRLNIFQYGNFCWLRKYKEITVISLANSNQINDGSYTNQIKFSKAFYSKTFNMSRLNIYSPFFISHGYNSKPSIGISHGIAWDDPKKTAIKDTAESLINIVKSSREYDELISVDTNTPKWIQTFDYDSSQKMVYVPNYVNLKEFYPRKDYLETSNKIIILFPRRFYRPRGLYLALDVIDDVISLFPNVEFHFVGRGYKEDVKYIDKKINEHPQNVFMYAKEPEEMADVYRKADISLIPTLFCEGTSLSLLEAMASGNAVIATRVGGLTDLIINDLNGFIIEPNSIELKSKIIELIKNKELLKQMKESAYQSSKFFNKDKWYESWSKIISKYIDPNLQQYKDETIVLVENNPFIKNDLPKIEQIKDHLQKNHIVFIKSDDIGYNKQFSYERIQFIDTLETITPNVRI